MRKTTLVALIFTLIFAFTLTACSSASSYDYDEAMYSLADNIWEQTYGGYEPYEINVEEKTKFKYLLTSNRDEGAIEFNLPEDFYEPKKIGALEMKEEMEVPKYLQEAREKVVQILLNFVQNSTNIKKKDKEKISTGLNFCTIHLGIFSDEVEGVAAVTKWNQIYINANLVEYISIEYTLIHEGIHIISNYTNMNSKSIYRGFLMNEALTDFISVTISLENGISDMETCKYIEFRRFAAGLIHKNKNIVKAYFYSDEYDNCFTGDEAIKFNILNVELANDQSEHWLADQLIICW